MSWLKGLAGKAEDLLNQIDQNAAVALQKDKKESITGDILTGVTWDTQSIKQMIGPVTPQPKSNSGATSSVSSIRSSPNLGVYVGVSSSSKPQSDDELIKYLNSSEPIVKNDSSEKVPSVLIQLEGSDSRPLARVSDESKQFRPVVVETVNENTSTHSSASSKRNSPHLEADVSQLEGKGDFEKKCQLVEDLRTENTLLKNELRSINNETSLLLQRAKAAEKECVHLRKELEAMRSQSELESRTQAEVMARLQSELVANEERGAQLQELVHQLQVDNTRLLQATTDSAGHHSQALLAAQAQLAEREKELGMVRTTHQLELSALTDKLDGLEAEHSGLTTQAAELQASLAQNRASTTSLQQQYERARAEANEAHAELDQYRSRAQRILQDKERLIAELRGDTGRENPEQDVAQLELQQLRQERNLLREEAAQVSMRLCAVREELQEVENRVEAQREQNVVMQTTLKEEQARRQAAEEEAEELRAVRDELACQRALLTAQVRDREAELTRLRTQLTQRPASPQGTSELEARLHALTQTLVMKQASLEAVSTERNALRLQLEKIEHKYRDTLTLLSENQAGVISVNDTDDAKARVPSFLVESPFDTGVTRRVKRAYSSLDAVSIRTGVFLRRYPLARILVVFYMVLLHLWVMFVLFAYTPQDTV